MFNYIPLELEIIQSLLSHRVDFLNPFFIFLNHLDSGEFYVLVGTLIYTLLNPRLGRQALLLLAVLITTNFAFKHLCLQPRPFILDPALALVHTDSPYGMPSGAAQIAAAFAFFLSHHFKKPLIKTMLTMYVVLISISRVYIGVHFISDVIVGSLLGVLIAHLFTKATPKIEDIFQKSSPILLVLCASLLVGLSAFLDFPKAYQFGCGLVSGLCLAQAFIPNPPSKLSYPLPNLVMGLLIYGGTVIMYFTWPQFPISLLLCLYSFLLCLTTKILDNHLTTKHLTA